MLRHEQQKWERQAGEKAERLCILLVVEKGRQRERKGRHKEG